MKNERFFKPLSVALLGLLALAFVPETHATDTQLTNEELPIEVSIVREVDEINAGRFNVGLAGEEKKDETANSTLVLSPVKTTTLTQVDPNL